MNAPSLRPLSESYKLILGQIRDQKGLATCRTVGTGDVKRGAVLLVYLFSIGYVWRHQDYRVKRKASVYGLTDLGAQVLASGQEIARFVGRPTTHGNRFTGGFVHETETRPASTCCHHWVIEGNLKQTWTCQNCGEVRHLAMRWESQSGEMSFNTRAK